MPGQSYAKHQSSDLLWIPDPFLTYKKVFTLKIVHGGTVVDVAQDFGDRVAVDTGADKRRVLDGCMPQGYMIFLDCQSSLKPCETGLNRPIISKSIMMLL